MNSGCSKGKLSAHQVKRYSSAGKPVVLFKPLKSGQICQIMSHLSYTELMAGCLEISLVFGFIDVMHTSS